MIGVILNVEKGLNERIGSLKESIEGSLRVSIEDGIGEENKRDGRFVK